MPSRQKPGLRSGIGAPDQRPFRDATFCPIMMPDGFRLGPPWRAAVAPRSGGHPMNVETILRNKGDWVATIRPDATIAEAVETLNRERIGALVVSADGHSVDGMVSERDIVIALDDHGGALLSRRVDEIMTRNVITCDPADTVQELMAAMTHRRFRHIPVVRDGRLRGIVSIGDVVKNRLDEVEFEANSLRSFIAGG